VRVFVTGNEGFLADAFMPLLSARHVVVGMDKEQGGVINEEYVRSRMDAFSPELIVHLAAYTAVDACETDPGRELASRVHETGSTIVARQANRVGARVLGISTDYVFDGALNRPYREEDPPNPLSVYGKTKLAGELALQSAERWLIVRSAWFFGPLRPNFVKTILGLMDAKGDVEVVDDQIGSPTYTRDLAEGLLTLIEANAEGLYHLTNGGDASWFDLAREAARITGRNEERIRPATTSQVSRPAPRPPYSVLDSSRAATAHGVRLRHWRDALAAYLEEEDTHRDPR
jgi:dTDP-4-dehydrorhamnose reductase